MRKTLAILIAPLALVAAACGSSSSSTSTPAKSPTTASTASSSGKAAAVVLTTRNVPGLGVVLVNGQGRTLYTFAPDKDKQVTCVGGCASAWPPLTTTSTAKPATSGDVKTSLVASDPDPAGGRVITYAGWPLYLYVADPTAGTANGQSINNAGGLWYVITPSGKVITKRASAGGPSTSTSNSGGSGY